MFITTVFIIAFFTTLNMASRLVSLTDGSSVRYAVNSANTLAVIACVLSFVAVIAAFIFIIPQKKRTKLNRAGRVMHDILNFRSLITEKSARACTYSTPSS